MSVKLEFPDEYMNILHSYAEQNNVTVETALADTLEFLDRGSASVPERRRRYECEGDPPGVHGSVRRGQCRRYDLLLLQPG